MNREYTTILPLVYKVFGSSLQHYNVTNLSNEEYKLSNSKDAFAFDLLNYAQMCTCTCTHAQMHECVHVRDWLVLRLYKTCFLD